MRGLYLHIPFCSQKCIYCDFYSLETTQHIGDFVKTLLLEIAHRASLLRSEQKNFDTIFFGGGTPSLLTPVQMEQIISALWREFSFAADAEITMECNPGTVSVESLRGYGSLGVNRLSFGVQSFFAPELEFLSRIHTRSEAIDAVEAARKAGFDNVNVDMMFALPHQRFERWRANLETASELGTEHISAYSLIFEDGTPLNAMKLRGEVAPQNDEADLQMYEWTIDFLEARGYEQYEVSNFAKPDKHCRHNCIYWEGSEYLAFGPSAHGYLCHDNARHERYWNVRSLKRYTDDIRSGKLAVVKSEELSLTERMFERIFLELRARGLRLQAFERDFGLDVRRVVAPLLAKYDGENLLLIETKTSEDARLRLTKRGYALCDAITNDVITAVEKYVKARWKEGYELEYDDVLTKHSAGENIRAPQTAEA